MQNQLFEECENPVFVTLDLEKRESIPSKKPIKKQEPEPEDQYEDQFDN